MTEQEFNEKVEQAKVIFEEKIGKDIKVSNTFANYIAVKRSGNMVYISGQLPRDLLDEDSIITGKAIGEEDVLLAKYASVMCAMQILFVLKGEIIDLSKVKSCVQLQVFVNSGSGFTKQHIVANGASDFICYYLEKITNDISIAQHTRFAVGVSTLPLGALVEVGAVFEI